MAYKPQEPRKVKPNLDPAKYGEVCHRCGETDTCPNKDCAVYEERQLPPGTKRPDKPAF